MTTRKERKQAEKQASILFNLEQKAILAAAKVCYRAKAKAIAAYKSGTYKRVGKVVAAEIMKIQDELAKLMVANYLSAIKRMTKGLALSSSKFLSNEVSKTNKELIKKGLKQNVKQIEKECKARAFKILKDMSARINQRIIAKVADINKRGLLKLDAIDELNKTFVDLGIEPNNSFLIETVFRTQSSIARASAQRKMKNELFVDEILWGYRYVTVGDDRVRESHAELDGVTLPKDDPFWDTHFPPNGWNCRCQALEIMKDELPEIVKAPGGVEVDKGFDFDPADII